MLRTFATAAFLAFSMTAAYADDFSIEVSFRDLDLSQPADAKVLADRLQDAAKTVCLKANSETSVQPEMQNCIDMAVSMAMARIENSLDRVVHAKLANVRTAMETP